MAQGSIRKADRVSSDLLRQIVGGEVQPGDLLPKEDFLAENYGVNRSVVREAVKLLEVHRLVKPIKRKGTVALNPMGSMSPEVIHAMLVPAPGRFDLEVLRDILEIRTHLDIQMTAMAAERRKESDIQVLEEKILEVESATGDIHEFSQALDEFSLAVAGATGNRIFLMMVHWHHRVHSELGDLMLSIRQPSQAHTSGLRILLELIRKKDVTSVRRLVEGFHLWATPRLIAAAALRSGIPLEKINDFVAPD